jgi:phosphoribosylformimino-5-aminoimidazole carboxamide ribotide isomerase
MIAVPAVDLREGRCVQLVGGRPEEERVSLPDPAGQGRLWWEKGFGTLHIVDLDAALGLGNNRIIIGDVVRETKATVQVGGGVRDESDVEALIELGARRIIVGTRAIDDPEWLDAVSRKHPDHIMVAADIREGLVVRKGWTESTGIPVLELLERLETLPLAGILCTDVSREGRLEGIHFPGARSVIEGSRHPVWISGGVTTMDELDALDQAGAAGAVLGMALYTETLSPTQVARRFGI